MDALQFLKSIQNIIETECLNLDNKKVINFKHPTELSETIDLSVGKPAENCNELIRLCKEITKYSVKTSHPHFYNQLYAGVDLFGLSGTMLSEALNTNQHTYEVAPAFSLTERAILDHVSRIFGYENGDGIFSPGGSLSNMYGMMLARHKKFPEIKTKGLHAAPQLVCFTSEDAHYSIQKGVNWLGLGIDNLIKVKTDDGGRMIPSCLEDEIVKCIDAGKVPLFVNATVGTTVLGAIDPLEDIANICQKYKVWFHVDACYGGTLMLSRKFKNRLLGIERSDSLAWNTHKMLGAPLQCAIFLTQHSKLLHNCNSASASYLFQQNKYYDVSFDTGDKSVQCGRKVDSFKLWVMWKARGDIGFEKLIDSTMECANYFKEKISHREGFRLIRDEFQVACVCFYYIPESMRNKVETDDWRKELYMVAPKIKELMVLDGSGMLGYSPLPHKGLGDFFRFVVTCQPTRTFKDMDYIIDKIEQFGRKLKICN